MSAPHNKNMVLHVSFFFLLSSLLQYYSPSDLSEFLKAMGVEEAPVIVIGPNNITNPGVEANLDIQVCSCASTCNRVLCGLDVC